MMMSGSVNYDNSDNNEASIHLTLLDTLGGGNGGDGERSLNPPANVSTLSNLSSVVGDDDEDNNKLSNANVNDTSNINGGITTLELHPNVILGLPITEGEQDDDSSNSSGTNPTSRPHLCSMCPASYKTRTHLRRHLLIHMSSRPYSCSSCEKGFNRKEHLQKHIEAVHRPAKHHCPYEGCDRVISRLDHLNRHIKSMHSGIKGHKKDKSAVLKVQIGKNGLKQKAQLSFLTPNFSFGTNGGQTIITPIPLAANHNIQQGASSPSDKISNDLLNKDTSPSMTIIPSNIVGPGQGVATLAIQSTPTQKVLVHQRLPSGSNVDLSTVTNGLAGLANLSLSLGQNNVSSNVRRGGGNIQDNRIIQIFNCGTCTSTFQSESELVAHTRTHNRRQPHHRCPECPRAYTRREKLTEHIRCVHQGQKFTCDYCGKNLSRKDHVLRHIRSIHPEAYAASFADMDESSISFDDKGRLTSTNDLSPTPLRKRVSTPTLLNIPSIGDVGVLLRSVCHVCLKVFGTAYHLSRHVESCHSGDSRPFKCDQCLKCFKRKDHLTKHSRSHCPKTKEGSRTSEPSLENESKDKSCGEIKTHLPLHQPQRTERSHRSSSEGSETSTNPSTTPIEQHHHHHQQQQVDTGDGNLRLLPSTTTTQDESMNSNDDCTHMILQNLQIELDSADGHGQGTDDTCSPSTTNTNTNIPIPTSSEQIHHHSKLPAPDSQFSVALIDSFIQGSVNVVVVDDEISNFLQQNATTHMTTTFPCGQCQREFSAREILIAHLQEHETDNNNHHHHSIHDQHDHDQRISDISFSDF